MGYLGALAKLMRGSARISDKSASKLLEDRKFTNAFQAL